ncbi:hypothetical protein IC582_009604 [Cucumis melo]
MELLRNQKFHYHLRLCFLIMPSPHIRKMMAASKMVGSMGDIAHLSDISPRRSSHKKVKSSPRLLAWSA